MHWAHKRLWFRIRSLQFRQSLPSLGGGPGLLLTSWCMGQTETGKENQHALEKAPPVE